MSNDRPMNRRRFFREGLRELLRPLAGAVEPIARAAKQFSDLESLVPAEPTKPASHWLRPPGAISEPDFLSCCTRSGECVRICPAQCIRIDPTGQNGDGAPYIDPDLNACVLCEGLLCTTHCPSGALQPVAVSSIAMGAAVWHEGTCTRTLGQACTICIDKCPVGSSAIRLTDERIDVITAGCVGCGVCQHECPSSPKSITVTPRSGLMQGGAT
jgi:ferredoxin-type protein NapG